MAEELEGYPSKEIKPLLLLRLADRLLDSCFTRMLSAYSISASEYHMLAVLEVCDESTSSPGVLAELVGQTKANTTRILDLLLSKKLIKKKKNIVDGRRHDITITKTGRDCVKLCTNNTIGPDTKSMMAGFSPSQLKNLECLLSQLILVLDDRSRAGNFGS
ncbi:winged helix-turn-helix transcriptional regulator [Spongiibacter nanhainus]|uniref:Winged helix-turn-helix transcriptional regulator n=2 Tax=Spongiibacter nanhainus TaxID=2794344 RepID=A0A7T4R3Q6_9GAMM|nr:winged helix-turn-helix transcriptional regulator [Spongiibacter nanhainus]